MSDLYLNKDISNMVKLDENFFGAKNEDFVFDFSSQFGCVKGFRVIDLRPHESIIYSSAKAYDVINFIREGTVNYEDAHGNHQILNSNDFQIINVGEKAAFKFTNIFNDKNAIIVQIFLSLDNLSEFNSFVDRKSLREAFGCSDMVLALSGSGRDNTIMSNVDLDVYVGNSQADGDKKLNTFTYRKSWILCMDGDLIVNEIKVNHLDPIGLENISEINLKWKKNTSFLLLDLPE